MKRWFLIAAVATPFAWTAAAGAQPEANAADTAFKEAMELRAAGHDAEACPKFAESQRLQPGVGVALYLADCYERTGRTASAWQVFRDGEKLARARSDKRADIAAQRAAAVEPKLSRLTISVPAAAAGADVTLDGTHMAPASLNLPLAIDPGDHVVTLASPGQPLQTANVHVDPGAATTIVRIGSSEAAVAPAAATVAAPSSGSESPSAPADGMPGRVGGIALMVAGAGAIGLGTFLVTDKVRPAMPNGQLCDPRLRKDAIPEGAVAFSAGGVALISGIVLYYVNRPGRTETAFAPTLIPGGAGATFHGTF